jgi:hypothetical protein
LEPSPCFQAGYAVTAHKTEASSLAWVNQTAVLLCVRVYATCSKSCMALIQIATRYITAEKKEGKRRGGEKESIKEQKVSGRHSHSTCCFVFTRGASRD